MSWEERPYADPNFGHGGGGFSDNPLNWALPMGRVMGIRVRVHITLLLFILVKLIDALGTHSVSWTAQWMLVGWVSVLLHEFGHCLAARHVGGRADDVLLWPLGGLAFCDVPRRPWPEFVTVVWGPLTTLGLGLIAAAMYKFDVGLSLWSDWQRPTSGWLQPYVWVYLFYKINLVLFVFNLWPMYPMDMGRIVHCALWWRLGYTRASMISSTIGMVAAVIMGTYGVATGQFILGGLAIWAYMHSYQLRLMTKAGMTTDESIGGYDFSSGHASFDRSARHAQREGFIARWRRKRAESRKAEEAVRQANVEMEVDRILDKVHREGMHSLSKSEKRTLELATKLQRESRGPRV